MSKTYTLEPTKHPDLFRVMDREGNWKRYFFKPLNLYLDGVTTVLDEGYAKGHGFFEFLANHTAAERDAILAAAGERGDMVHRAIDILLTAEEEVVILERETGIYNRESEDSEMLSNDGWDCLLAFQSFWSAHEPVLIASEQPVYNVKVGYAGTTDALLILTKTCLVKSCPCEGLVGKIGLYDWKTSGGIYASYSAQTGAYANADNLRELLPPKTSIDYIGVLRIGTTHKLTGGYEFKTFVDKDVDAAYARFLSAKNISDFERRPFDPTKEIVEIPDSIQLFVKKFDMKAAREAVAPKKKPRSRAAKTKKENGTIRKGKGDSGRTENSAEVAPVSEVAA